MPKSVPHHHLYKNYQTWTFRFRWPENIRNQIDGKYELHKSLGTDSLRIAIEKRNYLLPFCRKFVRTIREGKKPEIIRLKKELISLTVSSTNFDYKTSPENFESSLTNTNKDVLDRDVRMLIDEGCSQIIEQIQDPNNPNTNVEQINFLNTLKEAALQSLSPNITVPFDNYIQDWLTMRKDEISPKSLQDARLSVTKFNDSFPTLNSVRRKYVREWFKEQSNYYSPDRLKKFRQHLHSYWNFLKRRSNAFLVEEDLEPFLGINIEKRKNSISELNTWLAFPNLGKDIVLFLKDANKKGDQQLVNLIIMAMYTGMRIEEICSITVEHIFPDYIYVSATKSFPRFRKIPVHSMLSEPLKLMVQESTDGFLISGLNPRNKVGIRSDPIGKRFSQLKSEHGFGPNYVFHSIRKTVITIMAQEGVEDRTIEELMGNISADKIHGLANMKALKEAIEKLIYPLENL